MATILKFNRPNANKNEATLELSVDREGGISTVFTGVDNEARRRDLADAIVIAQEALLSRSRTSK